MALYRAYSPGISGKMALYSITIIECQPNYAAQLAWVRVGFLVGLRCLVEHDLS